MYCIEAENLSFAYPAGKAALRGVNLRVESGSFTAVLGRNGCGKSTLARHMNALLRPAEGKMLVCGLDTADPANAPEIRRRCGMVFQNPENQFVSPLVEEDIRFGLKNFGFPEDEIPERIRRALEQAGMSGFERHNPQMLSGGQKQRIALAGVLAVSPDILVFDEATAMLDPAGQRGVVALMHDMCGKGGKTVIMITQRPEEAAGADRVLLMDAGRIIADGAPREILADAALMKAAGLRLPFCSALWMEIRDLLPDADESFPLSVREITERVCR